VQVSLPWREHNQNFDVCDAEHNGLKALSTDGCVLYFPPHNPLPDWAYSTASMNRFTVTYTAVKTATTVVASPCGVKDFFAGRANEKGGLSIISKSKPLHQSYEKASRPNCLRSAVAFLF